MIYIYYIMISCVICYSLFFLYLPLEHLLLTALIADVVWELYGMELRSSATSAELGRHVWAEERGLHFKKPQRNSI